MLRKWLLLPIFDIILWIQIEISTSLHLVYAWFFLILAWYIYTAVAPGTVGTVQTVPLFLAGTANRTTIWTEKKIWDEKRILFVNVVAINFFDMSVQ